MNVNKKKNEIKKYTNKLINENPEILDDRIICNINEMFNDIISFEEIKYTSKIQNKKIMFLKRIISYDNLCEDNIIDWHIDDAYIISKKKKYLYKNSIEISEKKIIYYPNNIPKYTLMIIGNTISKDFKGGIIELSDGMKIKPLKNMCILINSKESYKINRIKEGLMKMMIIKFY